MKTYGYGKGTELGRHTRHPTWKLGAAGLAPLPSMGQVLSSIAQVFLAEENHLRANYSQPQTA